MNPATLHRMANDIARNFEALGHDNAVAATADHIAMFWDPRMKRQVFAESDRSGLNPVAAAAIERLARGNEPAPQTRATMSGGSDAG